ncbi:DUF2057 family protein [Marinobacter sp. M216]|uniref:DUF2057 family protein n=1 Tax=Marinobacter albus TaxID=3030833 RepID=A0ABT7HGL7_9GAMM|nr:MULTISPECIES: DUF2057 family protein [unclassified Marinobacter]MBW7473078.1 DUF2057 domain-containing protein [Marinobacter sp. F4218]MDK9559529.1 DUF2057 family protein [Marinobacter sp. M216]
MSIFHLLTALKPGRSKAGQSARFIVAFGLLLAMAGCSSTLSRVETWDGEPAAAANAATLKAPGAIQVSRINGRNMSNFLMDDLPLDYALLPGENEVIFTYKTIWAKSGVVENGESKVHVYTSEPRVVRFNAEQDEVYRFQFDQPESRSEAEQMAEDFVATVVTVDGQEVVAESSVWTPAVASDRTPIPEGGQVGSAETTALETLKSVWATATEEEKKAFLRWAFE